MRRLLAYFLVSESEMLPPPTNFRISCLTQDFLQLLFPSVAAKKKKKKETTKDKKKVRIQEAVRCAETRSRRLQRRADLRGLV